VNLDEIRQQIDSIDGEIINQISRRAGLVAAAGKLKKDEQGVRDPKRVEQVVDSVKKKAAASGLDPAIAEDIYRTIIRCFVRREMKEFDDREKGNAMTAGGFAIRKAVDRDGDAITAIFNHYVEHSFAAYPEAPVDHRFFEFMKKIIYGDAFFVLETAEKRIAGFAFLKRYHTYPEFNRVAETGYFILPEYTRKGLGNTLLNALEQEAGRLGIDTLLANISSHNQPSLAFHEKRGFKECGRFKRVSRKFGHDVDIVWMQKYI
jgi:L-amino acid N-acyltransferase YncA/chorismate mutase